MVFTLDDVYEESLLGMPAHAVSATLHKRTMAGAIQRLSIARIVTTNFMTAHSLVSPIRISNFVAIVGL